MAKTEITEDAMATEAMHAPVTSQRRLRTDLDDKLPKPCMLSLPFQFLFSHILFLLILIYMNGDGF